MKKSVLTYAVTALAAALFAAQAFSAEEDTSASSKWLSPFPPQGQSISAGTEITHQNWQQYKDFMPPGLQYLWEGRYHWKFPADFKMVIGPTKDYPLPKVYLENTRKYADQVKIVNLPNGGHAIKGYVAGMPFPNPTEPLKGWKFLVNNWYQYIPHLPCGNHDTFYLRDRFNNTSRLEVRQVYRLLDHISDPGVPITDPRSEGIYQTQFTEILFPEEARYTTILQIYYADPQKPQDQFIFIPALRRSLRLSQAARCAPFAGTDFTLDDPREGEFNGDFAIFNADYLGEKPITLFIDGTPLKMGNLDNWAFPVLIPGPKVGPWEVRNVYIIDVRRIPSMSAGYCYGKRILYIDAQGMIALSGEMYDENMKYWKFDFGTLEVTYVPEVGNQINGGIYLAAIFDMQNSHQTMGMGTDDQGRTFDAVNCTNKEGINFDDVGMFSSVKGLSQIVR